MVVFIRFYLENRSQNSEFRSQNSGVGSQKSEVRSQKKSGWRLLVSMLMAETVFPIRPKQKATKALPIEPKEHLRGWMNDGNDALPVIEPSDHHHSTVGFSRPLNRL